MQRERLDVHMGVFTRVPAHTRVEPGRDVADRGADPRRAEFAALRTSRRRNGHTAWRQCSWGWTLGRARGLTHAHERDDKAGSHT
jgi:hypothetical protein